MAAVATIKSSSKFGEPKIKDEQKIKSIQKDIDDTIIILNTQVEKVIEKNKNFESLNENAQDLEYESKSIYF